MSRTGIPSVMQITSRRPASAASRIASEANRAGTKITDVSAPVFAFGFLHRVEDRGALDVLAPLARGDARDDLSFRTPASARAGTSRPGR